MYIPRYYQEQALKLTIKFLQETRGKHGLIALPTGSGKSYSIADIIKYVLENWPTEILLASHSKEILKQDYEALRELLPETDIQIYSASLKSKKIGQVTVASIQSIRNKGNLFQKVRLIIVDEAHLIGPATESSYMKLFSTLPNAVVLGYTATPFRYKGMLTDADHLFDQIIYEVNTYDLIKKGFLSKLTTKNTKTLIDRSKLKVIGGDYSKKSLSAEVDRFGLTKAICDDLILYKNERKHWLIATVSIEHAKHVAEYLTNNGISSYAVHSKQSQEERDLVIRLYKAGKIQAAVQVNILSVGFDYPEIDLIGILRPTKSQVFHRQLCLDTETEILAPNGWKKANELHDLDEVYGFNLRTNKIEVQKVLDTVYRPLGDNEQFVTLETTNANIKITDNHKLVYQNRRDTRGWQLRPIKELIGGSEYVLPCCGELDIKGLDLTKAECNFIGWMMSDGWVAKNQNQAALGQSVKHTEYIKEIRGILQECNLKFTETVRERKGTLSIKGVETTYSSFHIFNLYVNDSSKGLGWTFYKPFLKADKSLPPIFNQLSKQEWLWIVETWFKGDRAKSLESGRRIDSLEIFIGNKLKTADRFQELCVVRGIRCSLHIRSDGHTVRIQQHKNAHRISFKGKIYKGSSNYLKYDNSKGDVWCIVTRLGTIVTRRKGKVAIMGNCGRGLRKAEGKTDCLILDYAGNTKALGPIDIDPAISKYKAGGIGEAPTKTCPQCDEIVFLSCKECPDCGFKFESQEKLSIRSSSAPILQGDKLKKTANRYTVEKVFYHKNVKLTAPPTLKVTYKCPGLKRFSEWLHFEGRITGLRNRSHIWWNRRSTRVAPISVNEALETVSELKQPYMIEVDESGQWPKITKYIFQESTSWTH